uniref:Transmembrane protein 98 n=1 Tax=Bos indicus x Bos taurus TaxID=30522 RepID=A0A4W2GBG1_BOBOX
MRGRGALPNPRGRPVPRRPLPAPPGPRGGAGTARRVAERLPRSCPGPLAAPTPGRPGGLAVTAAPGSGGFGCSARGSPARAAAGGLAARTYLRAFPACPARRRPPVPRPDSAIAGGPAAGAPPPASRSRSRSRRPIVDLIGAMETQSEPSELELDDVVITNPHIEAILENEDWIEDASGLMSHCIAILKICHTLTEKLVAMTMGSGAKMKTSASVSDIIVVAKRISPRFQAVCRIPRRRQPAGLQATAAPPLLHLASVL